jgi:ankyrin repeat protein
MKSTHRVRWLTWLAATSLSVLAAPLHGAHTLDAAYLEALRGGDAQTVRTALDHGSDPNARDAQGNSPLMWAAVHAGVDVLQLLLDRGADVNATNIAGATALMRAAFDADKVRLLVDRGANIQAQSSMGNTALMLAARPANSAAAVRFLLTRGADTRSTNRFGATALMAATAGGDPESVRLLLEWGADPNAQPAAGEGGFLFGGGRSPLMWAAFRGDLGLISRLLHAGAEVNAPSGLGTALAQAAWSDHPAAAKRLLEAGAKPDIAGLMDGYTPLHWAASSERNDDTLVRLLLAHGADPNRPGGEEIEAFMGTAQTPLMLARRRGETALLRALLDQGATAGRPDRLSQSTPPPRQLPGTLTPETLRDAINLALDPLQITSIESKRAFLSHESAQDCTSCHQQHLPMAAIGMARKFNARVNTEAERQLIEIVREGEMKDPEVDWQPLFHPDPAQTKGYELFAYAGEEIEPDPNTDAWVHHLAVIQAADGRWFNNLPRPPIQTGDIGATALAIHALQRYPLPGRRTQLTQQVERARRWLEATQPQDTDSRSYQLLGLAWAGQSATQLQPLAERLIAEQRPDGGWAQLPSLPTDAYATAQAVYALRVAARLHRDHAAVDRGLRFLLKTQLDDGTWHVRRRAFPFQPTMRSGFPHGRDAWISAAATSWAVMALSLPDPSAPDDTPL